MTKIDTWPIKKLGEVADYINGRAFKPTEWAESGLPIIRIQNLTETQEKFNYFNGKIEDKYLVINGDILLSWSASLGVYVWDKGNSVLNQHIFKVVPHKDINKNYLFYTLITAVEELKRRVHGSTMTHVTKPIFNKVTISVPPLKIQKQIVERMDKIVEAQKLNGKLIQKADELFQSLLHKELNPAGKDWETKKLGEICQVNPSKTEVNGFPDDSEIGFLTMADVSEDAEIINIQMRKLKEVKKGFTYFKNDDVLFAKITPCMENGKGALAEGMKNGIGFGSTEFHVLRAKSEFVLSKLLYFIVNDKSFRKNAQKFMRGAVGQQRVPPDYLEKYKIPLPPLKIQEQIVAKLSAAQEYKNQLLGQKSKLKELFDSVLYKSMRGEKKLKL